MISDRNQLKTAKICYEAVFKNKLSEEIVSDMTKEKLRQNAQQLRSNLEEIMDHHLNEMVDGFINEIEVADNKQSVINNNNTTSEPKKRESNSLLKDKEFVHRNSLLTDLFEVSHIGTIRNIFVAVLILFFLNGFLSDMLDNGGIKWDFDLLFFAFGKLDHVIWLWLAMKMSTIIVLYPAFEYWAWNRLHHKRIMDICGLFLYILYISAMCILPLKAIITNKLPPASSNIILCEQVRLIMKVHAFIRENVPRALKYKPHQDDNKSTEINSPCPEFTKFLYFLFAPTLIYRDNYPRTKKICWRYVVSNFLQVFGCVIYVFFVFQRFCIPAFRKFGHEPMTAKAFLLTIFSSMLPGNLVLLSAFYAVLHCWMNAFAEMLRFGDRMFYRDWWNSTKFSNYYRTWNVVVHDWLYTYVYKDFCQITGAKNRIVPLFMVFLLSALVHEYIVTFTFHFFFPILFVMFQGFGVWLVFITTGAKSHLWNVFVWMSLIAGSGILLGLYSMEWYSQTNCPLKEESLWELLIPRFFHCNHLFLYSATESP